MIKLIKLSVVIVILFLSVLTVSRVYAQTCEIPTSCQNTKTTQHVIEQFPCWNGTEPLFTNPLADGASPYNVITIDDDGSLGGENCGGAPNCKNELILTNPDPSLPVKGIWWRMHDHEEGLKYNLELCRTPLVNGTCTSWETVVANQGVHTSGEGGKEECSDANKQTSHPPGDQGCSDPLPDPKSCMQLSDRSDWPCALSFDEHMWATSSCSPQTITAFRIFFYNDNAHAHVADAIWIHDGSSCNIQGYKRPGQTPYNEKTITLKNSAGTTLETTNEQPYLFTNLPSGKDYIVRAGGNDVIGSTLCINKIDCHDDASSTNPAFQKGNIRKVVNCPANGYADLWWNYGKEPTSTPSATIAEATATPIPGYCTQGASITLSSPPIVDAGAIIFRVKFAGAFANNITENNNTQPLRVTVIKQVSEPLTSIGLQTISSKTFENVQVVNTGEVDENGIAIFEGKFKPTAITPGDNYSVLVKGPYHLQRKFCEPNPTEQAELGLPYTCKKVGNIALTASENVLDFSGVLLQAGDLPGSQGQDGVVNAYDVSLLMSIIDNKGTSEDPTDVSITDMDFNGTVNLKDRSNIIETLEEKYGDDEPL